MLATGPLKERPRERAMVIGIGPSPAVRKSEPALTKGGKKREEGSTRNKCIYKMHWLGKTASGLLGVHCVQFYCIQLLWGGGTLHWLRHDVMD